MASDRPAIYRRQMQARPAWSALARADLDRCILSACDLGRTLAAETSPAPLAPRALLDRVALLGVAVVQAAEDRTVRAEYRSDPPQIAVQQWSVAALAEQMPGSEPDQALAVHVAHELFHHLEEQGRLPAHRFWRPRRLPPLATGVLREIAAHEFAIALTGSSPPDNWLLIGTPPLV